MATVSVPVSIFSLTAGDVSFRLVALGLGDISHGSRMTIAPGEACKVTFGGHKLVVACTRLCAHAVSIKPGQLTGAATGQGNDIDGSSCKLEVGRGIQLVIL